ncbi:MAG: transglutaminase-like domain-containing protein [Polyangiaceae bacterium]
MKSVPHRATSASAPESSKGRGDPASTSSSSSEVRPKLVRFEELAALPDDRIDVALGFALVAKDVYASLDVHALLARFDALAAPLQGLGLHDASPKEQVSAISKYLFEDLGFRGNEGDYEDPRNSLLPDVLDRKLGIPITLALVYCEVARRVGVPAYGVGFPAHFLIGIDQPRALAPARASGEKEPVAILPILVDPFGGKLLERPDVVALLHRVFGGKAKLRDEYVARSAPRATLLRMLTNLKSVHLHRGDFARALLALDRILVLSPQATDALRERSVLSERLGAHEAAKADLLKLLEISPGIGDAEAIRARIRKLEGGGRVLH